MTTVLRPELEDLLRERATADAALAAEVARAPGREPRPAEQRRAEPRRWRRPVVGLGGLAAVGAGAVAVLLLSGGDQLSPLAEARAALGAPSEIVHFQIESYAYTGEVRHGPDCKISPTEVWQPTDGSARLRLREQPVYGPGCGFLAATADGVPRVGVVEDAYDGSIATEYVPALAHATRVDYGTSAHIPSLDLSVAGASGGFQNGSSASDDPQAQLRGVLATPGIRIEGVSTQDGRLVRTFVVPEPTIKHDDPRRPKNGTITYVVDAKTFAPVSITEKAAMPVYDNNDPKAIRYVPGTQVTRFASWERLPLDAAHESLLTIQLPPTTTVVSGKAKHFYQASRAVRERRTRDGWALLKAYRERSGATGCPSLREPCQSDG